MIYIQTAENVQNPIAEAELTRAAEQALQHQQADPKAELTIVISDDAQLQQLNRDFLGIDEPTDVLSFPEEDFVDPDTQGVYLGDILISLQRAALQAEAAGHPLLHEVQLLVVHGVLHLLGHDHAEEDEKARMWAAQDEILASLRA